MTDHSSHTCCVIDNGLFVETAVRLAKDFGRVIYYCPWESSYPKGNDFLIGQGLEGVDKVDSFWPYFNDIDLWVFPDVYFGEFQDYLRGLGKRVWGSGCGDRFELDRAWSKERQADLGIDIGDYEVLTGIDELRNYLIDNDNVFVKISKTRGDMETFHSKNYDNIMPRLDELEHNLGAEKNIKTFIVEDAIDDAVEVGYDGFTIDGQFPKDCLYGIEVKDKCYIGETGPYLLLPKLIRDVNTKMSQDLMKYKYRNFVAFELRLKGDKAYSIDPCCRFGSPPSELQLCMIDNLAQVMWHGANGELIDPIYADKWGAEILIKSDWANHNWQAFEFPQKYRDNIKLRYATCIDQEYYAVPQHNDLREIAAVVATGSTAAEAIAQCRKISEEIEGYYLTKDDAFDEALQELSKLKRSKHWFQR